MFVLEGCLRWPGLEVHAALWLYKEGMMHTLPELGVPILTQSVRKSHRERLPPVESKCRTHTHIFG